MGRVKLEIKKIENTTNRQVTFSKRRNGILKKAHELSVLCDVDVVLLLYSPSGKLTTFSSKEPIERILERFANTPLHQRVKRENEDTELLNRIVSKLKDERGEAPRLPYAQLAAENEMLKERLAAFERKTQPLVSLDFASMEDLFTAKRDVDQRQRDLDQRHRDIDNRIRAYHQQAQTMTEMQERERVAQEMQERAIIDMRERDRVQAMERERATQFPYDRSQLAFGTASTPRDFYQEGPSLFPENQINNPPPSSSNEFGFLQHKVEEQYSYGPSTLLPSAMSSYQGRPGHLESGNTSAGGGFTQF